MPVGRIIWNVGTSAVFGTGKYAFKFLTEPNKRGRNGAFLAASIFGGGMFCDIFDSAFENADALDYTPDRSDILNGSSYANVLSTPPYSSEQLTMAAFVQKFVAEAKLETINEHLEGTTHPETDVHFKRTVVELPLISQNEIFHDPNITKEDFYYPEDGEELDTTPFYQDEDTEGDYSRYEEEIGFHSDYIEEGIYVAEGIFPEFDPYYEYHLDEKYFTASDDFQFRKANLDLYFKIQFNQVSIEELGLHPNDVISLKAGLTPEGLVWHHNEKPGLLQLVDEETHANTGHTGGRTLWGGGNNFR